MRLELVSKSYAGRCKQQDPWYGGMYDRAPLEATWLTAWRKAELFGAKRAQELQVPLRAFQEMKKKYIYDIY